MNERLMVNHVLNTVLLLPRMHELADLIGFIFVQILFSMSSMHVTSQLISFLSQHRGYYSYLQHARLFTGLLSPDIWSLENIDNTRGLSKATYLNLDTQPD